MSATSATPRRKPAASSYRVLQLTQHWRILNGVHYRDCVVELADGSRWIYGIRDDLLDTAAAA